MTFRVVATARSFCNTDGPHHDYLRENGCAVDRRAQEHPLTSHELRALLPGYDGAILGLDICDAAAIEAAVNLRVISRYGAGVDQVDLDAATQHGIAVTNTPGANRIAVAELAIGMMYALARSIPLVAGAARNNVWKRAAGWELTDKTLGVVGFGEIGREVAARAQGIGMRVLAYDPFWTGDMKGAQKVDLPTLIRESDVITLHCALTPETESLINAERIAQMRNGACLINTARGGLVDETALYDALKSGKLSGAAADVFRKDPPTNNPLLALDNFIATPHIGATTRESVLRMSMMSAQNLVAVLKGEPCPYMVNAAALEQWRQTHA
ncbi:MAG: phosphoglycerate dehydrogenase [Anaerolineae bacterium]|nr:phosphoglycerate dehydrogenase [Anaerolineae bacterium]